MKNVCKRGQTSANTGWRFWLSFRHCSFPQSSRRSGPVALMPLSFCSPFVFRWLSVAVFAFAVGGCVATKPSPLRTAPWKNSLGMPFVEVPVGKGTLLMASEETQEKHLAAFRRSQNRPASDVARPAANVSWIEAVGFCDWLTKTERATGRIDTRQRYRLPTDHEWSCAAGIGHLESPSKSPEAKSNRIRGRFPWGTAWPPPSGAGNLCGEESARDVPGHFIAGYRDACPGGELKARASGANEFGLYDLSGNVWEWCSDRFREGKDWRVLRGGAWKSARQETLLSSHRTHDPEHYRSDSVGFRCVLARD